MSMTRHFIETLLFASVVLNAGLLLFFAGVFRQILNAVDAATFKNLTDLLVRYSSKSVFMIVGLNLPLLIAIPYYYLYGFANWWVTASLILWLVAGSISKMLKLPVYKDIAALKNDNTALLIEARKKVNRGNTFQAVLYCIAVVVMAIGLR
jgi:hypothetical protein